MPMRARWDSGCDVADMLLRCLQRLDRPLLGLTNGREFVLDMTREDESCRPLLVERDLRRHRSCSARAEYGDLERLPRLRDRRLGGGRLVPAMRHAVRALL